jgi:hypothetical protein
MTTTDSCQQQLFCRRQLRTVVAAREQMPVDIGCHLDRRVPQAVLHYFARRTLGRARRERPRRRAAEQRDELAPPNVLPSVRGSHPTTSVGMPRCASQQKLATDGRDGSTSTELVEARSPFMSAVPPVATDSGPGDKLTRLCQKEINPSFAGAMPAILSTACGMTGATLAAAVPFAAIPESVACKISHCR